tara:strand:+ start:1247 stop:1384 length:138 start_codon:yes stop_codon:yes gene_type:complete
VKHVGFSYSDVQKMPRKERYSFAAFLLEETDLQKENIDKASNSPK